MKGMEDDIAEVKHFEGKPFSAKKQDSLTATHNPQDLNKEEEKKDDDDKEDADNRV